MGPVAWAESKGESMSCGLSLVFCELGANEVVSVRAGEWRTVHWKSWLG
jgi:hypothetical protein